MSQSDKITLTGVGVSVNELIYTDAVQTSTNHYTQWVNLTPGEMADLAISVQFSENGDNVLYRIIKTLDDDGEGNGAAPQNFPHAMGIIRFSSYSTIIRPVVVTNCYRFRVEFRKQIGDDGAYIPNVYMRTNGLSMYAM